MVNVNIFTFTCCFWEEGDAFVKETFDWVGSHYSYASEEDVMERFFIN